MKRYVLFLLLFSQLHCNPLQAVSRKRTGNKLKIASSKSHFKTSDLLDAIQANDKERVKQILDKLSSKLDIEKINKAFVKTITGRKKKLKPEIALLFLKHPKIQNKLNGESLDKALIKSIRNILKNIFSTILQNPLFRNKLYTTKNTKDFFDKVLEYAPKNHRKKIFLTFLSYPDLCNKVKHLDFITQDHLDAALEYRKTSNKSKKEEALLRAAEEDDLEKISNLLDQNHHNIRESVINEAFVKTISKSRKNLNPEIALLFLQHPEVKKKINGVSLDKALMKSIYYSLKTLFSTTLEEPIFRKKLYTNKSTREAFDKALKYASKRRLFHEFLSYPDLRAKVQHLDFITQHHLDAASKREKTANKSKKEKALLCAVEENNLEKISNLFDQNHHDIRESVINEAFVKTVTRRKKDIKPKISVIFLTHPEVKKKINGKSLEKALIKSIQENIPLLFSTILQDPVLRNKIYTSKDKAFENSLRYLSKYKKKYFYEFISYPDLYNKVQHLDFVTRDHLKTALKHKKTANKSDKEQDLITAIEENDLEKVSTILDQNHQNIREKVINEAFVKTITGTGKKNLKPEIALLFLKHPEVKKKLNGQSLDRALIKSMQFYLYGVFSAILKDPLFRDKLYTSKNTKVRFEQILKRASKYAKKNLYRLLSYQDLYKKVQHLDFITKDHLDAALRYRKAANKTKDDVCSDDSSSDDESSSSDDYSSDDESSDDSSNIKEDKALETPIPSTITPHFEEDVETEEETFELEPENAFEQYPFDTDSIDDHMLTSLPEAPKSPLLQDTTPPEEEPDDESEMSSFEANINLMTTMQTKDIEKVKRILMQHHGILNKEILNLVFIQATSEEIIPEVVNIFLSNQNIMNKLNSQALNQAFIAFVQKKHLTLALELLKNQTFRDSLEKENLKEILEFLNQTLASKNEDEKKSAQKVLYEISKHFELL